MQERRDAGKEGYRKRGMQGKREAGKGEIQTRCKMVDLLKLIVESVSRVVINMCIISKNEANAPRNK